jgi:hypothetical protein
MHEWQSLSHVRWGRLLSERETRGNHTWGRDDSIVAGYSRANRLSIQWSTVWVWLVHYTYLGLEFKYGVPRIPWGLRPHDLVKVNGAGSYVDSWRSEPDDAE